jgi:hypothetical protein
MILELIWNCLRPSVFLKQCRHTLMKQSSQNRMTLEAEMRTEFIRKYEGKERLCVRGSGWEDITKESCK